MTKPKHTSLAFPREHMSKANEAALDTLTSLAEAINESISAASGIKKSFTENELAFHFIMQLVDIDKERWTKIAIGVDRVMDSESYVQLINSVVMAARSKTDIN